MVVLAVYNGKKWLGEQVNSIINQTDVDVSIAISIDPSTDGSEVLCYLLASQYKNIIVLPSAGKFGGAAKNFFRLIRDVDFSNFDYFAFADQDDIWFEAKLIIAVNKLIETKSEAYSSNVIAFWEVSKKKLIKKSQPQREWDYLFEAAGPGCTYVITAKLATEIKFLIVTNWIEVNKLGFHDWFCYAYARAKGFKWFIDSNPGMLYRQHVNNEVGANAGYKAFIYRLKKVSTGWSMAQSLLIAKLIGKHNSSFVKSWCGLGRYDFFKLAFSANKCRRKPVDRLLFFCVCVLMSIIGFSK